MVVVMRTTKKHADMAFCPTSYWQCSLQLMDVQYIAHPTSVLLVSPCCMMNLEMPVVPACAYGFAFEYGIPDCSCTHRYFSMQLRKSVLNV